MDSKYLWLLLVWVAGVGIIVNSRQQKNVVQVGLDYEYRYHMLPAVIMFLPIVILAGIRKGFGDTEVYRGAFLKLPDRILNIPGYIRNVEKDKGFTVFNIILKDIIGNRDVVYFLIIAAICGLCLVITYRKYSCNYMISILLFIMSGDYIQWMFNGIRQFIPVTVIFAMMPWILEKKYGKLIISILLLSTIHATALLMIPVIFIVQGRAWNKKTIFFIVFVLLSIAFVNQFTNIITNVMENSQYSNEVGQFLETQGTSKFRVLVFSVPTFLAYICRNKIGEYKHSIINLCVNMSIMSTGFYIISMFTSGIFIGRIPIYFSLYNYILLPWEIEHLFTQKSMKLIYILLLGFYFIFYYYQTVIAWGF